MTKKAGTISANPGGNGIDMTYTVDEVTGHVRRLMPVEVERLMGFEDGYTLPLAFDTPRLQALGNSMAVPVIKWIFNRIGLYVF